MYSFVIKRAIDLTKSVLDDITTPMLGLIIDNVDIVIAGLDQIKISVIIFGIFFHFFSYTFL